MTMMDDTWTDTRIAKLKILHAERLSFAQIAAAIGGVTRHACIGKANRLGLSSRRKVKGSSIHQHVRSKPKPKSIKPKAVMSKHLVRSGLGYAVISTPEMMDDPLRELPADAIPVAQRKQLLEMKEGDCRWPYGDVGTKDFFFCGDTVECCGPYCAFHYRIAYQPANKQRERMSLAPSFGTI